MSLITNDRRKLIPESHHTGETRKRDKIEEEMKEGRTKIERIDCTSKLGN